MARGQMSARRSPYKTNHVGKATFTIGAEAANVITVAVQLQSTKFQNLTSRGSVDWYLSDDANGDSIVATAASGGVAAGTDGVVIPLVTGKMGKAISEADGDIDIAITHVGAKTCYLVIVLPDGSMNVSNAITFSA
jgi:hypothetical protein